MKKATDAVYGGAYLLLSQLRCPARVLPHQKHAVKKQHTAYQHKGASEACCGGAAHCLSTQRGINSMLCRGSTLSTNTKGHQQLLRSSTLSINTQEHQKHTVHVQEQHTVKQYRGAASTAVEEQQTCWFGQWKSAGQQGLDVLRGLGCCCRCQFPC